MEHQAAEAVGGESNCSNRPQMSNTLLVDSEIKFSGQSGDCMLVAVAVGGG